MSGDLKKEILGVALAGVFLFLFVSLLSYHPFDPSFNTVTEGAAKNLCGKVGSYISDVFMQIFGMMSYLLGGGWRLTDASLFRTQPRKAGASLASLPTSQRGLLVLAAAALLHDLPEHRVIHVAAAVVAHGGADVLGNRVEPGENRPDLALLEGRPGDRLEVIVKVRLVVLVVVDPHRLLVDPRFQGLVVVGQGGKYELCHFCSLLGWRRPGDWLRHGLRLEPHRGVGYQDPAIRFERGTQLMLVNPRGELDLLDIRFGIQLLLQHPDIRLTRILLQHNGE